jgi:hypothetical protein
MDSSKAVHRRQPVAGSLRRNTMKITTYSVTHAQPRTHAADADAIIDRVNAVTAANGDSLYKDNVQAELNSICSAEIQELYGINVIATEQEIDE